VRGILSLGNKLVDGEFEFDTGSNGSLWLNQAYAKHHFLYGKLKKIDKTKSRGVGENVIYNEKVIFPELKFGAIGLTNVPVDIELPSQTENLQWSILGMDVLKRFNTIIDYQHDEIFLKPNSLINNAYTKPLNMKGMVMATVCVVFALTGFLFHKLRRRKRQQQTQH
jgi:hypothetical protein